MAVITVTKQPGDQYLVVVQDGGSSSQHRVTVSLDQLEDLGGGASAEELIEASFGFLLEREPKESILSEFELPVIGRYFPEYPGDIRRRLSG
ncbi:MAG: hypothetical protein V3S60_01200 [Acidimicrobiia bacterium]|jgi:hypothetical protein